VEYEGSGFEGDKPASSKKMLFGWGGFGLGWGGWMVRKWELRKTAHCVQGKTMANGGRTVLGKKTDALNRGAEKEKELRG